MKHTLVLLAVSTTLPLPNLAAQDWSLLQLPGTHRAPTPVRTGPAPAPQLRFIENRGQWPEHVRFLARAGGAMLRAETGRIVLQRQAADRGATLALQVEGAAAVVPQPEGVLPGTLHFLCGSIRANSVPSFAALLYRGLRAGVDLRVRQGEHGFEYDVLLAPGADLDSVVLRCEGARELTLDAGGALVAGTALGDLVQPPPRTFTVAADGKAREVPSRFRLLGRDRFGFAVDDWDRESRLVIDPGLLFGSYLGGADDDTATDMVRAEDGTFFVLGHSSSASTFPTTFGAFQVFYGGGLNDAYVAKFDPRGSGGLQLVWCTFFGGNGDDQGLDLCLRRDGSLDLAGTTTSTDLPVTPGAFQTSFQGGTPDGFVARLTADGRSCQYCTYFGTNQTGGSEDAAGVADAPGGRSVVVGWTRVAAFPPATPNAHQGTFGGGAHDCYVVVLDPARQGANQVVYATLFGGSGAEWAQVVSTDAAGVVTFAGGVTGGNLVRTASSGAGGSVDCFVARLDWAQAPAQQLVFSHVFGSNHDDYVNDMVVDRFARPVVVGDTHGHGLPVTAGALQGSLGSGWGGADGFVLCLEANGQAQPRFCTYLGGGNNDYARCVSVDSAGMTTVAGMTSGGGFYGFAWSPYPSFRGGPFEAYVARLDHLGRRLHYATYYGGNGDDRALAAVDDGFGHVVVAGYTTSTDLAVQRAFQGNYQGGARDALLASFDLLPPNVARVCTTTPACNGRPIAQHVSNKPTPGQSFALISVGGPEQAFSTLVFGLQPANVAIGGVTLCTLPFHTVHGLRSDAAGYCDLSIPVPPGVAGTVYTQWVWENTTSCGGANTLSASDALRITFP